MIVIVLKISKQKLRFEMQTEYMSKEQQKILKMLIYEIKGRKKLKRISNFGNLIQNQNKTKQNLMIGQSYEFLKLGIDRKWQQISLCCLMVQNLSCSMAFSIVNGGHQLQIQYLYMGKKPQKCNKNCNKHCFSLKPVEYFAYISRDVQVSFCPPTLKHHKIIPIFNRDQKHYTSSFCLKEDEAKYKKNDDIYKKQHEKFRMQQQKEKSQMLMPKPRSKQPYCHVCKDFYTDYSEHTQSANHKTCLTLNKFSCYINELISSKYSQPRMQKQEDDVLPFTQEEMFCEKEINSNTTLPNLGEDHISHGFTFVGAKGDGTVDGMGWKLGEALSPEFQNLVKRCSTVSQMGSDKKSASITKFPIIITALHQ